MELPNLNLQPGQIVGQYRVVRPAGEGGMGTVYLAEDTRLHRNVALKVVAQACDSGSENRERFMSEAQTLASLNHPNIVSLFDIIDCDGHLIMVMEWVDGQPLTAFPGELTDSQISSIGRGICSALVAAHAAGIIHGDIKPANVMLGTDGRARLLDFGISRCQQSYAPQPGAYSGTIPYMAPELLRGADPTPQSDLFSLGVLLYEVATGRKPFAGEYEAAIEYAILNTDPALITSIRPDRSPRLAKIISKLLVKDVSARYLSASEVSKELESASAPDSRPMRRTTALGIAGITILLGVIAFGGINLYRHTRAAQQPSGRSIAVLPFENLGDPSQEYFADGLTDAVISGLSKDTQLSVISRAGVMPYKRTSMSLAEIAEDLSVQYILTGSIQRSNDTTDSHVRISASLVDPISGRNLWADVYDRQLQDLFSVQSELAQKVHEACSLRGSPAVDTTAPTSNLQAYDLYLRGNDYFNRGWSHEDIQFAIVMYQRAIAKDSNFALAYAMLARGHASMFWEYFDRSPNRCQWAKAAAERALSINPGLAEAHLAQGYCFYHCDLDYIRALEEFHLALQQAPKNSEVLNAVAAVERRQGNLAVAADHFKESLELDPRSYLKAFDVGLTYGLMREYDEANHYLDRAISLGPDWPLAYVYKAWLAILRNGDVSAAADILAHAPGEANLQRSHYFWWLQRIVRPDLKVVLTEVRAMDDTAAYYLFKSQINRMLGLDAVQRVYADSARRWIEARLTSAPSGARYYSYLGLAYAGLKDKQKALQFGQKALELLPSSRDSFETLFLLINMAEILVVTGEYEMAATQIQAMLTMPGFVSIPYFQVDPLWKPLAGNAVYQQIIGKKT